MNFKKTWKRFMTLSGSREGFTLVELIVVIAILAILAGVAVPVYSGYIKKANEAADQQLLGVINTAFGAACLENRTNAAALEDGSVTFNISDMSVSLYDEEFQRYFAGNESSKFEVIKVLYFVDGVFTELPDSLASLVGSFTPESIAALQNSTFNTIGAAGLMDKVDFVTTLATNMLATVPNGTFADIIKSPEYGAALAEVMGYDVSTTEGQTAFVNAMNDMLASKTEQLLQQNPEKYAGMDPTDRNSDLYKDAQNAIYANNAVLYAAQNSESASEDILTILGGNNAAGTLTGALSGSNSKEGLAQAAMAYGLYTAYAAKNNVEVPSDPAKVLAALDEDTAFKTYINDAISGKDDQAQKDLDGYLAAMDMINTSTDNKDAVSDVLVNGFSDPALVALLQSAMNQ